MNKKKIYIISVGFKSYNRVIVIRCSKWYKYSDNKRDTHDNHIWPLAVFIYLEDTMRHCVS